MVCLHATSLCNGVVNGATFSRRKTTLKHKNHHGFDRTQVGKRGKKVGRL